MTARERRRLDFRGGVDIDETASDRRDERWDRAREAVRFRDFRTREGIEALATFDIVPETLTPPTRSAGWLLIESALAGA